MKAKFIRQYRKQETGKLIHVYELEGSPEELAKYKADKEEAAKTNPAAKYIEDKDSKKPLMFSSRGGVKVANVIRTSKGEYQLDMSKHEAIKSLTDQGYTYEHAKDIIAEQE